MPDFSKFTFHFSFLSGWDVCIITLILHYINDNRRPAWPCQDKISALEDPLLREREREGGNAWFYKNCLDEVVWTVMCLFVLQIRCCWSSETSWIVFTSTYAFLKLIMSFHWELSVFSSKWLKGTFVKDLFGSSVWFALTACSCGEFHGRTELMVLDSNCHEIVWTFKFKNLGDPHLQIALALSNSSTVRRFRTFHRFRKCHGCLGGVRVRFDGASFIHFHAFDQALLKMLLLNSLGGQAFLG